MRSVRCFSDTLGFLLNNEKSTVGVQGGGEGEKWKPFDKTKHEAQNPTSASKPD